jgi:hypothetical protein
MYVSGGSRRATVARAGRVAPAGRRRRRPVRPTTHLVVNLSDGATAARKTAIKARLAATDHPDVVDNARPEDLPESYKVDISGLLTDGTLAEIRALPGVDQVQNPITNPGAAQH